MATLGKRAALNTLDRALTRAIHWHPLSRRLRPVAKATTNIGSMAAPLLVGAIVAPKHKPLAMRLVILGCVGWGVGQLLKLPVNRPRPYEQGDCEQLIAPPQGTSFPSGHTVNSATFSGYFAAQSHGIRRLGWALIPCWVGYTRIVLGVHYVNDILAGHVIGWLLGTLMRRLDQRLIHQTHGNTAI